MEGEGAAPPPLPPNKEELEAMPSENGAPPEPQNVVMTGGEKEKAADFANYFCSYASLYHQKQMLTDHRRMQAYYSAIMENAELFKGAVVLDVGTGSGILALWCAKAGASKVYAAEFTDMAVHARRLIQRNGAADVVEVLQTSVEDMELPCKVDIIISEWMGYFLLRESMLDSLVRARDRWLKPGGLMFPSHATMYVGLVSDEQDRLTKYQDYIGAMQDWYKFKEETRELYKVDMGVLENVYVEEQTKYYILSSFWAELHPDQMVGPPAAVKQLDMHTCTLQEVQGVEQTPFSFEVDGNVHASGFAGWFNVDFRGTAETPCQHPVVLSTGPDNGYTHWGQQVFYLQQAAEVLDGGRIEGSIEMTRQKENVRLYDVVYRHKVVLPDGLDAGPTLAATYNMP